MISVASRKSLLAQAQVKEIAAEIAQKFPHIILDPHFIESHGDQQLDISLRTLDKTDFFTREIDQLVLDGVCRIAVHSAKDLPAQLPKGLDIFAITKGVDSSDALVLRPGESIDSLPNDATIAVSSQRREEMVRQIKSSFRAIDVRGAIEKRLEKLENGEADGVVVAEAALIRLGLTHLNRVRLPGETTTYQGQLAVVGSKRDLEMRCLFSWLDTRQDAVLHLGLEAPQERQPHLNQIHLPVIATAPVSYEDEKLKAAFANMGQYTHILLTSKEAVNYFFQCVHFFGHDLESVRSKKFIAVGPATAQAIIREKGTVSMIAKNPSSEGIIEELKQYSWENSYLFWPHSSQSRDVIANYMKKEGVRYAECHLYNTHTRQWNLLPNLETVKEIHFTSPSTVRAFIQLFGKLPRNKQFTAIGPITEETLIKATLAGIEA